VEAPRALYLHVPFCPQVCPYCEFHKMRRNGPLVAAFVERIEREAAALAARYPGPLETVYLGGGTPSHLTDAELERVLAAVRCGWGGLGRVETTLEADPGTFDAARAARWRAAGITRLSIGMQSTRAAVLRFLGRSHDAAEGLRAAEAGLAAGLHVSLDVITAVPGQDARADLNAAASSGAQHVSVYTLTIEPGTPFARRGVRVDEERAADEFDLAEQLLAAQGLARYEVSNHARPGFESHHNRVYWRGDGWLALGPSAAGFEPPAPCDPPGTRGVRTRNGPIKAWLRGDPPERTPVDGPTLALELLMTGLRTRDGIDLRDLRARTDVDVAARYPRALGLAREHGLLVHDGSVLRATDHGVRVLDAVLRQFFAEH
jgi:putative oxygen-independent coproporphyrinogen III oxidase